MGNKNIVFCKVDDLRYNPTKIFKLCSIIWDIMTDKFYSAVNPPLRTTLLQQNTQGPQYCIGHM